MMMIVVVCGSRDWTDRQAVNHRVAALPSGTIVIQGGSEGADKMARHAAALANLHYAEMPANGSRGTQDTIDEARRRGIEVEVHTA